MKTEETNALLIQIEHLRKKNEALQRQNALINPKLKLCPPNFIDDVRDFMLACGQAEQVVTQCSLPPQNIKELRRTLIESEHKEFFDAWFADDIVEIADALADMIYVIVGTAIAYGIPLDKVWRVVQKTNMAKLWTWEEVQAHSPTRYAKTIAYTATDPIPMDGLWKCRRVLVHPFAGLRYCVQDEIGKVRKPPSWVGPEKAIKTIIEEAKHYAEEGSPPPTYVDPDYNREIPCPDADDVSRSRDGL